jgi:hypothetical protein
MPHGDPVYISRERERQVRHVQLVASKDMRLVKQLHPIFTQNLFDERSRELIVPGRNGSVCGEDAKATDTIYVEGFYSPCEALVQTPLEQT